MIAYFSFNFLLNTQITIMSGTPTINTAIITLVTIEPPNIATMKFELLVYCSSH